MALIAFDCGWFRLGLIVGFLVGYWWLLGVVFVLACLLWWFAGDFVDLLVF